jgi:hypothetical protein
LYLTVTSTNMKSSFHSLIPFLLSLFSHSIAIWRDSLSYSSGIGPSLYSLISDPTEHTISIVSVQEYFYCCLSIRCRRNLFTETLPSNECLIWLSGVLSQYNWSGNEGANQIAWLRRCLPAHYVGACCVMVQWPPSRAERVTTYPQKVKPHCVTPTKHFLSVTGTDRK